MHRVVIIDDEPPARAKLKRFLESVDDFQVVGEADSVDSGIATVAALTPEVLYLDIQLGSRSGFDLIEGLSGDACPYIVFTTAYSEHAVRAFDVQALDYLLKPFDRERFLRSIERLREVLEDTDHSDLEEKVRRVLAGMPGQTAPVRQLLIKDKSRAYFIDVDSIDRLSAAGNYVEVHTGGQAHLVREPLARLITQLDTAQFIRVHRSHVVRVGFIQELRPLFHGDYELVLRNGARLNLSRRYKALLPASIREKL